MLRKPDFTPFEYVPKDLRDAPEEERETFILRCLKYAEREEIARIKIDLEHALEWARAVLNAALIGWKSEGVDGSPRCERISKGGRRVLSEATMDVLGGLAPELALEVVNRTILLDSTRKNS